MENRLESVDEDFIKAMGQSASIGPIATPYAATGKSGVRHQFTLGAAKNGKTSLACDIVVGNAPVDETKVLALFIKVYDLEATSPVLCAVPSISEGARRLAGQYKISVLESSDSGHLAAKLSDLLPKLGTGPKA